MKSIKVLLILILVFGVSAYVFAQLTLTPPIEGVETIEWAIESLDGTAVIDFNDDNGDGRYENVGVLVDGERFFSITLYSSIGGNDTTGDSEPIYEIDRTEWAELQNYLSSKSLPAMSYVDICAVEFIVPEEGTHLISTNGDFDDYTYIFHQTDEGYEIEILLNGISQQTVPLAQESYDLLPFHHWIWTDGEVRVYPNGC